MNRFRVWLIHLLGGHLGPKKVFVEYEKVDYQGLGRPFEISDWERLATLHSWGGELMRFLAFQVKSLDEEERVLGYGPEKDRDRLALSIRRAVFKDLQALPDTAAAKVAAAYNQAQEQKRPEKGLSNHGR